MKTIKQKEFDELVGLHQLWLEDNSKGKRLEFTDCIIKGIICKNKNLSNAEFYNSKFYNSKFYNSMFRYSKFYDSEFYNSTFYNCIGNGKEIVSMQFGIYNVVMLKDIIAIGCEQHTVKEWLSFTDKELESMDEKQGIEWWSKYSKIVFDLHKTHFGVEQ